MPLELTGNAGTTPTANFLVTTDNEPLIIKTDMNVAGNFGIGTTSSPQKPLDIAASGGIRISRSDSASLNNELYFQENGQIRSFDDNHRIIFDRANNLLELRELGDLVFSPGARSGTRTQKVTFQSNGYVGIGTSTPARSLHVENTEIHSGGAGGGFSFGNRETTGFVESPGAGERWNWYSSQGMARLWSGSDKLAIASNGYVGIGTAAPVSTLNLNSGDAANADTLTIGNASTKGLQLRDIGDALDIQSIGHPLYINNDKQNTQNTYINASGGNVGIGTNQPDTMLTVAGQIHITAGGISSNGNVGIGTSSPQKPLDIATSGGIQISQSDSASPNNELYFQENGQIRSHDDYHRIIFDRANNLLELRERGDLVFSPGASSGTPRTQTVTFKSNGYVGIGTTAPQQTLDVNGNIRSNDLVETVNEFTLNAYYNSGWIYRSNGSASMLNINTLNGGQTTLAYANTGSAGNAITWSNGIVLDNATGNVGIGTNQPEAMLTVAGQIHITVGGIKFPDGTVQTTAR